MNQNSTSSATLPAMQLEERKEALAQLGERLRKEDDYLQAVMHRTQFNNPWFTMENQQQALDAISDKFLRRERLTAWLKDYDLPEISQPRSSVGLVMAGNIPLVGFHDLLCVFVAGHHAMIKLSDKDQYLLPYLLKLLRQIDERTGPYFTIAERLKGFDAVIATGSNNSSRYFDYYFGRYPNIIRRNRNAVAVLSGEESREELRALGRDVFRYFGLGCRNVSKVYVPKDYSFEPLLETLHEFNEIILHNRYKNNFDYNYAVHVLNKWRYMANGCILLSENSALQSPIGSLHYEYYTDLPALESEIAHRRKEIQCVVSGKDLTGARVLPFGKAQEPELWDYADGVDTLAFLIGLEK